MRILYANARLKKVFNNHKLLKRKHGARAAAIIRRRLDDLYAADTLADMRTLPGRCHELRANRAGQLALDLDHPRRLVFEPANDPIPRSSDGGLIWEQVTAVVIIGVEDYHGK